MYQPQRESRWESYRELVLTTASEALLFVDDVTVEFHRGHFARRRPVVRAVSAATIEIGKGQAFGLVGESGSGKTTLGRCVLGQQKPTHGSISISGKELSTLKARDFRATVQAVFQNPIASLNPAMSVGEIIAEPLRRLNGMKDRVEMRQRSEELLDQVQLPSRILDRRPASLSGGMAQRVSIARALAPHPSLIVLDEAVSALDVATQAQVINLLADLRDDTGVSYLFIAHDLAVVRHLCDEVAVMKLGEIVEHGNSETICGSPKHRYTQALLQAVPVPDPTVRRLRHRHTTSTAVET